MNHTKGKFLRLVTGIGVLAGLTSTGSAALLTYEGFDYPVGDLINQNGGIGWSTAAGGAWTNNSTGDTIVSGSLSYVDGLGNSLLTSGNSSYFSGVGGTAANFPMMDTTRNAGTTWISFVGQRTGAMLPAPSNTWHRAANVALFNTGVERIAMGEGTGRTEDTWSFITVGNAANTQASSVPFAQQSLVVVRIDHDAINGTNDLATMFLNPTFGIEPTTPFALQTNDFTFNRIRPFAGNPLNGHPAAEMSFDEFRVGTTYADVTPFVPVPEPSTYALFGLGAAVFSFVFRRKK